MSIWRILRPFGRFLQFWYVVARKIWQPWLLVTFIVCTLTARSSRYCGQIRPQEPKFTLRVDLMFQLFTHVQKTVLRGSENPLLYNDTYDTKFHCNFELADYPFDRQKCYINVSSELTRRERAVALWLIRVEMKFSLKPDRKASGYLCMYLTM
jgi:hypothetical protein